MIVTWINKPHRLRYNLSNRPTDRIRVITMATVPITIEVDEKVAKAYADASAQDRMKMKILVNLKLMEFINEQPRPLLEVIEEISANAAARGLTPEILESILRDEE